MAFITPELWAYCFCICTSHISPTTKTYLTASISGQALQYILTFTTRSSQDTSYIMRYATSLSLFVDDTLVQKVRPGDSYTINVSAKSTTVSSRRTLDGTRLTKVYPTSNVSLIDPDEEKPMAMGSTSFVSGGSIRATKFRHAPPTAFDSDFDDDPSSKHWTITSPTKLPLIGEES